MQTPYQTFVKLAKAITSDTTFCFYYFINNIFLYLWQNIIQSLKEEKYTIFLNNKLFDLKNRMCMLQATFKTLTNREQSTLQNKEHHPVHAFNQNKPYSAYVSPNF